METNKKSSRLNKKSYLANLIFFLPAISFGINLGNSKSDNEFYTGMIVIAQMISLVLVTLFVIVTIHRLHDANRRGWYSFALIPPFTIFLLCYLLVATDEKANKWGDHPEGLTMFGIKAKGWRFIPIVLIAIFMLYLAGLFATFLFDSGTY